MSKRLQVVLSDEELSRFAESAKSTGMTLSEWVRQTLRTAEREVSTGDAGPKLAAIRRAHGYAFPAPDIDGMLAEIERGYTGTASG
ncbi:MAG: antitoxin [Candidatus Dormibacteria bacterium]